MYIYIYIYIYILSLLYIYIYISGHSVGFNEAGCGELWQGGEQLRHCSGPETRKGKRVTRKAYGKS